MATEQCNPSHLADAALATLLVPRIQLHCGGGVPHRGGRPGRPATHRLLQPVRTCTLHHCIASGAVQDGEGIRDKYGAGAHTCGLQLAVSYPHSLCGLALSQVSKDILAGVEGAYIGDRTSAAGPVFQPTSANIKMMLQPSNPPAATLNPNTSFAYFTGSWGVDLLQTNSLDVTCFFDYLTAEGEWPESHENQGKYSHILCNKPKV